MASLRQLHQKAREFFRFLLAQHRTPGRVAWALGLGLIIGCTPLFGVQVFLCIAVAYLLRLNFVIVYAAANISIPPLAPFIGLSAVRLGELVRQGRWVALARGDFFSMSPFALAKRFFVAWLIGGTLLGAGLGLLVGGLTYVLLRRRQAQHKSQPLSPAEQKEAAIDAALQRAARRYDRALPRYRYYARAKYRLDPCYRELLLRIPAGSHTVDLGCGQALLGVALAELGEGRSSLGIDWDSVKLTAARIATTELAACAILEADVREAALPACDVVALCDVLHYYQPDTQRQILRRAVSALRPGGQLLLRETDGSADSQAGRTRLFERWMVRLGWNRAPQVYYRALHELRDELVALGLSVSQQAAAGATHPGNFLLQGRKPEAATALPGPAPTAP
jgi:uncharacterized protein (DUF2062 family)/SAM-dependent methyltransferase